MRPLSRRNFKGFFHSHRYPDFISTSGTAAASLSRLTQGNLSSYKETRQQTLKECEFVSNILRWGCEKNEVSDVWPDIVNWVILSHAEQPLQLRWTPLHCSTNTQNHTWIISVLKLCQQQHSNLHYLIVCPLPCLYITFLSFGAINIKVTSIFALLKSYGSH